MGSNNEGNMKRTGRGFAYLDAIEDTYGGTISVSESSSAMEPKIWVRTESSGILKDLAEGSSVLHMSLEQAEQLKTALEEIIQGHSLAWLYQERKAAPPKSKKDDSGTEDFTTGF